MLASDAEKPRPIKRRQVGRDWVRDWRRWSRAERIAAGLIGAGLAIAPLVFLLRA